MVASKSEQKQSGSIILASFYFLGAFYTSGKRPGVRFGPGRRWLLGKTEISSCCFVFGFQQVNHRSFGWLSLYLSYLEFAEHFESFIVLKDSHVLSLQLLLVPPSLFLPSPSGTYTHAGLFFFFSRCSTHLLHSSLFFKTSFSFFLLQYFNLSIFS